MRNLSEGMTKPCAVDVKLGSVAYNPKKLERQKWKASNSTSSEHAFRLCGLSFYESGNDDIQIISKYQCRSFQTDQMRDYLAKYFSCKTP